MSSQEGVKLSQVVRRKIDELSKLCEGLDEATASQAPSGRWSPKEILSHLCGPEGGGAVHAINAFLEQDTPRLDMVPSNAFFTANRARMTFAELLAQFKDEYNRMADVVSGLSVEQLARKAHIPMLKESPLGEYPTLAVFVQGMAEHHLVFHIDHMREILQALGKG